MKKLLMLFAIPAIFIPVNALALSTWSSSNVIVNGAVTSMDSQSNSSGAALASAAVTPDAFAASNVEYNANRAGVQARANAVQPGGAHLSANGYANWDATWFAVPNATYVCSDINCSGIVQTTFHLDGVLDPLLVVNSGTYDNSYLELFIDYYYGGSNRLSFGTYYDSGWGGGVQAYVSTNNGTADVSNFINFGNPNANGDIPFTFDYTSTFNWYSGGEFLRMRASVDNYGGAVSHNIDVAHTFTVSHQSLDPGITWTNDNGQTMPGPATSSVPEPSTLLLSGSGIAGLVALRRFRKK